MRWNVCAWPQTAGNAPSIALQEHFRRMAEFWTALSAREAIVDALPCNRAEWVSAAAPATFSQSRNLLPFDRGTRSWRVDCTLRISYLLRRPVVSP